MAKGSNDQYLSLSAARSGFKSFSLTSVELQMLTNSCVKLQTVHSIPLTINKEGGRTGAARPRGRVRAIFVTSPGPLQES